MYTVVVAGVKHRFVTLQEVIDWAWNTYKIDYHCDESILSEEMKHNLCSELSYVINHPGDRDAEWKS